MYRLRADVRLLIACLMILCLTSVTTAQQKKTQKQSPKPDPNLPHVLIIGDSISIDYTKPTIELLQGTAHVERVKANCGDTKRGLQNLERWLRKTDWDVIHLEALVKQLEKTGATLIWATTTPVPEGEAGRVVGDDLKYNEVATKIMKQHGIKINDLHQLASGFDESLWAGPGNVHFKQAGFSRIGEILRGTKKGTECNHLRFITLPLLRNFRDSHQRM